MQNEILNEKLQILELLKKLDCFINKAYNYTEVDKGTSFTLKLTKEKLKLANSTFRTTKLNYSNYLLLFSLHFLHL